MIVHAEPVQHAFSPFKVAILTGLSRPDRCTLSAVQRRFLDALDVPPACKVPWNFPYVPCDSDGDRIPPLWLASLRNGSQFFFAARRRYRNAARRHWRALAASARSLVIVTGSCGLEILNQCLGVEVPAGRIHVFALGPVARRLPAVPHTLVQGSGDSISRWFFRKVDVVLPGASHLDYFGHPTVTSLVNGYLCGNTLKSQAPGCTFPE